jgi:hypothetical protein
MKQELIRQEGMKIRSWINDKPISTHNWDVFGIENGDTEYVLVAKEPNSGNQLKIIITRYQEYEDLDKSGNEIPESE